MRRCFVALALFTTFISASLVAQTPAPPAAQGAGTPAAAPQAPSRPPLLSGPTLNGTNIRIEITITDTFGGTTQTKTVAMTMLSGASGMIRTSNNYGQTRLALNVDAVATAYPSGQVPVRLTVSYQPLPAANAQQSASGRDFDVLAHLKSMPAALEESITVVLTDGQNLVLTESADPATDRKVTLAAKATILK